MHARVASNSKVRQVAYPERPWLILRRKRSVEAPKGLDTETEGVLAGVGDVQEAVLILLSNQSLELQYAAFLIWVLRTLCSS